MTSTRFQGSVAGAAVNNAIRDPLQGFDCDVWVLDQATGRQLLIGRFTSIQITIRNATEPYMEMNQRVPRMLDGEFQFGWVLERGLLDTRIMEETFGIPIIQREMRIDRSPRFMITFDLNAPALNERDITDAQQGPTQGQNGNVNDIVVGNVANYGRNYRRAVGQYRLSYCKVDALTIGAMAGRSVIATRWEGLAEGITYFQESDAWAGTTLEQTQAAQRFVDRRTQAPNNDGRPDWVTSNNQVGFLFPTFTG